MPPSSGELWGHHLMPHTVTVDCLLPNGIIVPLRCYRESPLEVIKNELWREAKSYPLFHILRDPSLYIFVSVTQDAEREEFYDEGRRLCDLRLFQPMLKLVEPKGNKEEKMLNYDISIALGISLQDFDEMKDPEVAEFRRHLIGIAMEAIAKREENGVDSISTYSYPPEIENNPKLPPSMEGKLDKGKINVAVWSLSESHQKQMYTIAALPDHTPEKIIEEAIMKRLRNSTSHKTQEEKQRVMHEYRSAYVLKVAGCDQYLLKSCPISQYKYVRSCLAKEEVPQLMLMLRKGLTDSLAFTNFNKPAYVRRAGGLGPGSLLPPLKDTICLWKLDSPFRLQVISATYVNLKDADQIYVRLGVFHGTEAIATIRQTQSVSPNQPRWDEWVEFEDLFYLDAPKTAKLCVSICAVKKRKTKEETTMLCWGNVGLFDWRNCLLQDKTSLNLWNVPRGMDDLLNPLGVVGSNPVKDSPCLELLFECHSRSKSGNNIVTSGGSSQQSLTPVVYPEMSDWRNYAGFMQEIKSDPKTRKNIMCDFPKEDITEAERQLLVDIAKKDPLAEISEQDKTALWNLRKHCLAIPNILPRFLDAVKWNSREDLAQLYILLEKWPMVEVETALELLDCKYADPLVREKAVEWLDARMTDEDLGQFILQLVQTLKYEPYLSNALSSLLLKRSLLNRKIGHFFFWHLKAELQTTSGLEIRFGLILEAFCRGLGPYLKSLNKQVEALDKLTKLTDSLKEKYQDVKDRMKIMTEQIKQPDYIEGLQFFNSPLDPSVMLGELNIEECKVMDSAKKPLWLVWKNPDQLADKNHEENAIIFKNGDDLRQDMLTLQVIRILDHIWHTEGLDLRMTPYTCLATGHQVGMIQVVRNAKTVYQIQRQAGKLAAIQVDSSQLYKWIKEHNKTNVQHAIDTFTLSCAGYCVATFILGIGDRHPDNIMVNQDGQIFHIDFGHFLGHFKKKFGFNRERVPFVLTEDFLLVIGNGKENPKKSDEFAKFQEICGKAYLALRRHSSLLITLFTMMLPTGITELQSINDVDYLRQTLRVEKTEQEALEYFQSMFYDAYGGAWTTKLDWFFHSVRHGV